ncbi:MAG TPA: hypothetical protein VEZ70_05565 [Allosphingosinicella sp.]|nr:hypothetical protein [Allosphingosinicella sp.]
MEEVVAIPASAQSAQPIMVGKVEAVTSPMLKQGAEIRLVTLTELNSKEKRVGERFDMEVQEAVKLNGQTVIPAGTRAVGEITLRKGKGMWGKSGKLEFRLLYVQLGDRRVNISANATRDKGKAGTAGVVASVALLPLAGFFVTGTSASIPAQTPVTAYLDEDVPVVFAAPAHDKPLVVPASAPRSN